MPQASRVKSLALRVLRESADSAGNETSCPRAAVSERSSETGQGVGQKLGQGRRDYARIRGQDAITESAQAETCWHCHGEKVCGCAVCAVPAGQMRWEPGQCAACKGSGFLCWPDVFH